MSGYFFDKKFSTRLLHTDASSKPCNRVILTPYKFAATTITRITYNNSSLRISIMITHTLWNVHFMLKSPRLQISTVTLRRKSFDGFRSTCQIKSAQAKRIPDKHLIFHILKFNKKEILNKQTLFAPRYIQKEFYI